MGHDHHHDHHGHHHHAPANYSWTFAIAITLNIVYVGVETFYGFLTNSLALIADAGHNFSDVIVLLLAWGAHWLAKRKPTLKRTYGLRRAPVLAALLSAVLLLVVMGAMSWEAVQRIQNPVPVQGKVMMIVAGVGVIINTLTALMLMSGSKHDLNIRGAFLHMAADALVSLGAVVAGLIILNTGLYWIDPAISLVIVVVIVLGTIALLRDSLNLALDAVPESIDAKAVNTYLNSVAGVTSVHDFHIWGMSTTQTALTAHLVRPEDENRDEFLRDLANGLKKQFGIDHVTIQIEHGNADIECQQDHFPCT
ncbi:MAG TPA: cation transporter [Crenotrichaceae bacterium]|nr:cation transporter [Crenotrichaceae bacterium]